MAGKTWCMLNNPSYHGFSEMLYEFTSANANNGSGLKDWVTIIFSGT
jgi:K+-transporting ATPase ATPase A chain